MKEDCKSYEKSQCINMDCEGCHDHKLYALYVYNFGLCEMVRVTNWTNKYMADLAYNSYSQVKREIRILGE